MVGQLDGKVALVAGGAGEVGEGIVRQFLRQGATVVVPSRSEEKLRNLCVRLHAPDALITEVADVASEEDALRLRAKMEDEVGSLDHVVASLGGWWQGAPLTEVPLALWHSLLGDSLSAHFVVAKTFLPALTDREGGSYTLINGGGALRPVPGAGPVVVSAAAQLMLKDVLAAEHEESRVRVNSLVLATPVLTRSRPQGHPEWLSANDAGAYAAYLASSTATERGETVVLSSRAQLPGVLR